MLQDSELSSLNSEALFALAIHAEEFNIRFFNNWSNRLRAFDIEAVNLLTMLAKDAEGYCRTLREASAQLFENDLPEPEPAMYIRMIRHVDLPRQRYFVVNDEESREILSVALGLQKNTITLLGLIDQSLQAEYNIRLFRGAEAAEDSAYSSFVDSSVQETIRRSKAHDTAL